MPYPLSPYRLGCAVLMAALWLSASSSCSSSSCCPSARSSVFLLLRLPTLSALNVHIDYLVVGGKWQSLPQQRMRRSRGANGSCLRFQCKPHASVSPTAPCVDSLAKRVHEPPGPHVKPSRGVS